METTARKRRKRGERMSTPRPVRTIRVEDDLWLASLAAARERDEALSEAIRRFLKRYAKGQQQ